MDEARTLPFKDTSSLQDIHFKFDRYDLDEDSRSTLRKNAGYLKVNSSAVIEVQGHCDERGTEDYNLSLGERRALAVVDELLRYGVTPDRVRTTSYGEKIPITNGLTEADFAQNRRGEFVLLKPAN